MNLHPIPLILLSLTVGACSPADTTGSAQEPEAMLSAASGAKGTQPDDCLLLVWSNQSERKVEFDREHDFVDGGAISCATGTTASQFEMAISALREAASSGNKARLLEEVGLPLLYIDSNGDRREITDRDKVQEVFDEIFDPAMIELLQRLDLSRMSVAKDQGAFFELGAIWLVVDKDGGRPRLVTVNRQALDEAASAAQRQATLNQGQEIPLDR